jgi:hypothetical protein
LTPADDDRIIADFLRTRDERRLRRRWREVAVLAIGLAVALGLGWWLA